MASYSSVCAKALGEVPLASVSLGTVRAFYAQPPALREQLKGLAQLCTQRLVAEYGDVPATLGSKELRGQFAALPVEAVLAFARTSTLRVTSENDVLVRSTGGGRGERAGLRRALADGMDVWMDWTAGLDGLGHGVQQLDGWILQSTALDRVHGTTKEGPARSSTCESAPHACRLQALLCAIWATAPGPMLTPPPPPVSCHQLPAKRSAHPSHPPLSPPRRAPGESPAPGEALTHLLPAPAQHLAVGPAHAALN